MKFTDKKEREWSVVFTIGVARRIRDELGFDLMKTQEVCTKIAQDAYLMIDATWLSIEEQATKEGVSKKDFYDSLEGEHIEKLSDVFIEALQLFIPSRAMKKIIQKSMKAIQKNDAELMKEVEKIDFSEIVTHGN